MTQHEVVMSNRKKELLELQVGPHCSCLSSSVCVWAGDSNCVVVPGAAVVWLSFPHGSHRDQKFVV